MDRREPLGDRDVPDPQGNPRRRVAPAHAVRSELLSRTTARAILGLVLLAGAFFRFEKLDWDEGHHLHPDERFISMVEENLRLPAGPLGYFDSAHSPLNPYNRGYGSFVYGTLPMFATKLVALAMRRDGYDGSYLIGRALSGLFDLLTIWLVYRLVRRFASRTAALFAAALLAFAPLGIQLSHFWAVDTFLATFSTAALYGAVRIAQGRSGPAGDLGTGVAIGLAAACKVTALALFAPVGLALLVALPLARRSSAAGWVGPLARLFGRGLLVLVAALVAVRVTLPYAFRGLRLDPRYLADMKQLAALSSSVAGFPPALQWAGRTLLFPVRNFLLWGAGPFFGIAALVALVGAFVAARRKPGRALLPVAAYALFVGLYHGLTLVKSIRYFYPAYPAFAALAGLLLGKLASSRSRPLARALAVVIVAGSFLWAVAFTAIYRRPHTRVEASRWIFAHVPPPARFANEAWDDGQPMPLPGHDVAPYAGPVLELFDPDAVPKLEKLLTTLSQADWIAVTSNRVYGNVTRVPIVFPMTTAYYRALFSGALGFAPAAQFASYPSFGALVFPDDSAEEQFTVYDHPRVLLFRKTREFSVPRARRMLAAAMPSTPPTMNDWEKWPRSRRKVTPPVIPPRTRSLMRSSGGGGMPDALLGSVPAAILFFLVLAAVGAAAFPLCFLVFSRLPDRGFGFARVVGLVLATYGLEVAVAKAGFANGRGTAVGSLLVLAAAGGAVFFARRDAIRAFLSARRRELAASEIVFAIGFVLFVALRAFNPEIVWGEKPMDFSILNILVRTRTLPPSDPWFAGAPLGYYTFGQEIVALLSLATGLSTRYTFNLAFGLIGGVLLQGAYALARAWTGRLAAGIAGAWLTVLAGNLSGLREWLAVRRPQKLPLDWNYFWATSRVIKDTINEYPLWSLLFADLHAHVLSMPVLLLFLAQALQFVRVHADPTALPRTRLLAAALLGFFAAAEALTNAWDAPLLAGLLLLATAVAALSGVGGALRSAGRAVVGLSTAAAAALVAAAPLWPSGGSRPAWGRNLETGASGLDVATVFGLFFLIAGVWWLAAVADRKRFSGGGKSILAAAGMLVGAAVALKSADLFAAAGIVAFGIAFFRLSESADDRLAAALAGSAFFLILFAQRLYLYDRMNTFFKLYLECWVLFAIGCAVLAFRERSRPGAFDRWPLIGKAGAIALAALSLFTTVTVARGALTDARPTRRGGPSKPTLDGLDYLERTAPGEYRAVLWLRRNVSGTPVVLEAQGASYQDFGRISMLTGLPTVLGWEYHVQQRGNSTAEIARRRAAVATIYESPTAETIEELLRRYHVGYVYVGSLERKTYPRAGLAKFDAAKNLFELVYENPDVRIYRVAGGEAEDVLIPQHEELPAVPGKVTEVVEPEELPIISSEPAKDRPPYSGMKEPRDAAVDEKGRLWVADFGNSRLRLFDADGGYLGGFGGRGDSTYNLRDPCGVASRGDLLYVADTWNGRVEVFTIQGAWKATAAGLYGPRGIAAGADGAIWVTDTGNHRVVRYGEGLTGPRPLGKKGKGPLEFDSPVGIAVGPSGRVYVCDTGNRRIAILDAAGAFAGAIPFPGWNGAAEPHIEVDADETLYVSDPPANVVFAIGADGAVRTRFETDRDGRRFAQPTGVAIDPKSRILYVVNSATNSISRLSLPDAKGK